MRLECAKDRLLSAVMLAGKISGRNLTLPVLNCILLSAEKKQLKIRATNLELGIEITVPAKIEEEGTVAVPAAVLQGSIAALLTSEHVRISAEAGNLKLVTPISSTLIKAQGAEEFPTLPPLKEKYAFKIKPSMLLSGFRSVWFSASTSLVKPELSSVNMYGEDGSVVFVATDSFRLAEKKVAASVKEFPSTLIPIRNVAEIMRVLEISDDEVEVLVGENQIGFRLENILLVSRLIDGTFPDYQQIIPKDASTVATVLKQDFLTALKKLVLFSDAFNQVRFSFLPMKKKLLLEASNPDVGEARDELAGAFEGEDLAISFNHKYLIDAFQAVASDSVTLSLHGLGKPMVIRGVSDHLFLYLVMPMNK